MTDKKSTNKTKPNVIEITQKELTEIFDYSSETGLFKWKLSASSRAQVGTVAGCTTAEGYRLITYNKCQYKAHRLAWIYVYGELSERNFIDHINGNPADNRLSNLRLCSNAENQRNVGVSTRNTSGFKGVGWCKILSKWRVRPTLNGEAVHVGYYENKADAIEAYREFCVKEHGSFYKDSTLN